MGRKRLLALFLSFLFLFSLFGCKVNGGEKEEEKKEEKEEKDNKWEEYIALSDFSFASDEISNYVTCQVMNKTDKYLSVTIVLNAESGSIKKQLFAYPTLKPKEIQDISFSTKTSSDYSYEIDHVVVVEKEIPKLDESDISLEALEYYYPDILEKYQLLFTSIVEDYDIPYEAPYIKEAYFDEYGLMIKYYYGGVISIVTVWEPETSRMVIYGMQVSESVQKIYYYAFLYNEVFDLDINHAFLLQGKIQEYEGEYRKAYGWVYMSEKDNDGFISLTLIREDYQKK